MSNVVDMAEWCINSLNEQARCVYERGPDVELTFCSGVYHGYLSGAPKAIFDTIIELFNALDKNFGEGWSGAVCFIRYDDKTNTSTVVEAAYGYLLGSELERCDRRVELEVAGKTMPVYFIFNFDGMEDFPLGWLPKPEKPPEELPEGARQHLRAIGAVL